MSFYCSEIETYVNILPQPVKKLNHMQSVYWYPFRSRYVLNESCQCHGRETFMPLLSVHRKSESKRQRSWTWRKIIVDNSCGILVSSFSNSLIPTYTDIRFMLLMRSHVTTSNDFEWTLGGDLHLLPLDYEFQRAATLFIKVTSLRRYPMVLSNLDQFV